MKLGGDVPFDGTNQVGATVRADNLEIIYVTNRNGSTLAIDLWHAQRSSATADFLGASVLPNVNDPSLIEKMPTLRSDGLELYFVRADSLGSGAIWRATRASTGVDFDAPQMTSVVTGMNIFGTTLSGDGLTLMYSIHSGQMPTAIVYATSRASTSDMFGAGAARTDFATVGVGLGLSPDGRYAVTQDPASLQLQVHVAADSATFAAPVPIVELQAGMNDAMPSIAPDGMTLYFGRKVTTNNEIWYATRQ